MKFNLVTVSLLGLQGLGAWASPSERQSAALAERTVNLTPELESQLFRELDCLGEQLEKRKCLGKMLGDDQRNEEYADCIRSSVNNCPMRVVGMLALDQGETLCAYVSKAKGAAAKDEAVQNMRKILEGLHGRDSSITCTTLSVYIQQWEMNWMRKNKIINKDRFEDQMDGVPLGL